MRYFLICQFLLLVLVCPISLLGQGDSVNTRGIKEVRAQWPRDRKGKMTRAVMISMFHYHGALVRKDWRVLSLASSRELQYQHSNGWIETQEEQFRNLETGYLVYHRFVEDSVVVDIRHNKLATVRFKATIDVSLQGKRNTYHLYVEEDWSRQSKKSNHWLIFARRATKLSP